MSSNHGVRRWEAYHANGRTWEITVNPIAPWRGIPEENPEWEVRIEMNDLRNWWLSIEGDEPPTLDAILAAAREEWDSLFAAMSADFPSELPTASEANR